jgi:hypothetical protein
MSKREQTLQYIVYAGYHNDKSEFTRLYCENRISMTVAKEHWNKGQRAKERGIGCGCNDCNKKGQ